MRRRDFIKLIGSSAAAWPPAARAQQAKKIPRIGFLWHAGSREQEKPFIDWVEQGFTDLGYVIGKNIFFEERYPNEIHERFDSFAVELANLNVDVLVSLTAAATKTIPIVFTPPSDPVGLGLVASLAHPGGNITGLSSMGVDLVAKRVQLF